MKEFDAWSILTQCSPVLEGTEKISFNGSTEKCWVAPRMYCAWDRGFYFQPIVTECDFGKFAPIHASKRSFFLLRVKDGETKTIKDAVSGIVHQWPVVSFYIFINKNIFPEKDSQNEIEWLNSRTPRTTAIAHELVFADQYANRYDVRNPRAMRVTIPTPPQEEELMCPSFEIENLLHGIESSKDVDLGTVAAFNAQQQTTAVQKYYEAWLKKHAVEDNVVRGRTNSYLSSGIRGCHQGIANALATAKKKHKISEFDELAFLKQMRQNSDFARDFIAGLIAGGLIKGFQQLHISCCIGSKQDIHTHTCKADFHNTNGSGCSAVRCDFIRHAHILIQRNKP